MSEPTVQFCEHGVQRFLLCRQCEAADRDDDELEYDVCGNIGCVDGWVADCFDGFCVNAEDGCELCLRRCDWCNQKQQVSA